jgi:predicted GNAT family acetyltransferase
MAMLPVRRKKERCAMPDIIRENHVSHGAYRADVEGTGHKAELTWVARGNTRIANHTYVPHEARGKGIAGKLVDALIADARSEGFKIVPQCSYVEAAFRRHPEWADVLADTAS